MPKRLGTTALESKVVSDCVLQKGPKKSVVAWGHFLVLSYLNRVLSLCLRCARECSSHQQRHPSGISSWSVSVHWVGPGRTSASMQGKLLAFHVLAPTPRVKAQTSAGQAAHLPQNLGNRVRDCPLHTPTPVPPQVSRGTAARLSSRVHSYAAQREEPIIRKMHVLVCVRTMPVA